MSRAIAAQHGEFGRACVYRMNKAMATHAHREAHLIFHISGQLPLATIAGVSYRADQSTAFAVNPLQPHDLVLADNEEDACLLVLYINPHWFYRQGQHEHGCLEFGTNAIELTPEIFQLARSVTELLTRDDHPVLINLQLFELTTKCYERSWHNSDDMDTDARHNTHSVQDHRVRKAIRVMQERISDDLVLIDIAKAAGLSRPHFFKLFRANVGVTPNVYVNTLRMERSIEKLTTTDQPVTSIGLDLGFASQASFSRFFCSNVGIPPSDYRRAVHMAHEMR